MEANSDNDTLIFRGTSWRAEQLRAQRDKAAELDTAVLISGEPGTGKAELAAAIHRASARAGGPFVVCELGSIEPAARELEVLEKKRQATGGTLFLDEIGELLTKSEPLLSRIVGRRLELVSRSASTRASSPRDESGGELRERSEHAEGGGGSGREASRGGPRPPFPSSVSGDVRIIASTSLELQPTTASGTSRLEASERLFATRIEMPPLRERADDIALLVRDVIADFARAQGRPAPMIAGDALEVLTRYEWPGNLRELASVIQRAMCVDPATDCLGLDILRVENPSARSGTHRLKAEWKTFKEAKDALLGEWEAEYLRQVLERSQGNMTLAARQAGIARGHLYRLLKKHALCR